ncbi:MAG: roadblock/LC7 domain-containing protein [bacterium]
MDTKSLDAQLGVLQSRIGSKCVILITKDGEFLTGAGDTSFIDITALSALIAGMFSATQEVAHILGEAEFSILFQQGEKRNIHISIIGPYAMMVIIYEDRTITGLVNFQAAKIGRELIQIFKNEKAEKSKDEKLIIEDFKVYAVKLIDSIFKE